MRLYVVFCCALALLAAAQGCATDTSSKSDGGGTSDDTEVSAKIGTAGGTLEAQGVSLDVPAGALEEDVVITAKRGGEAPSAYEGLSPVFRFGPEGLQFKKPITISFDLSRAQDTAVVFFTKLGLSEFEDIGGDVKGSKITVEVSHFSSGFAGLPLGSDAAMPSLDGGGENVDGGPDGATPELDGGTSDHDSGAPDGGAPDGGNTSGGHVTITSRDDAGALASQTWAAFQDGDGAWQALAATSTGKYDIDVTGDRFGVAFVCASQNNVLSSGTVMYAVSSTHALTVKAGGNCAPITQPTSVTLSGLHDGWRFTGSPTNACVAHRHRRAQHLIRERPQHTRLGGRSLPREHLRLDADRLAQLCAALLEPSRRRRCAANHTDGELRLDNDTLLATEREHHAGDRHPDFSSIAGWQSAWVAPGNVASGSVSMSASATDSTTLTDGTRVDTIQHSGSVPN